MNIDIERKQMSVSEGQQECWHPMQQNCLSLKYSLFSEFFFLFKTSRLAHLCKNEFHRVGLIERKRLHKSS